jgi:hypothetical protein
MKGWMYALIGFILAGLGGIVYYFGFYKKEEETGTAQEKPKADNNSTPPPSNQNQVKSNDATPVPAPVQDKPDGTVMQQNAEIKQQSVPKSQGKPKKEADTKPQPVLGDVFTDIYAKQAKLKISEASKNGKALVQVLINKLLPVKERIVVDGKWGPRTGEAFAKVQNKINLYVGDPKKVQYDSFVVSVIKFIHNYKSALIGIDMDDIKEFIRQIPPEKVFIV